MSVVTVYRWPRWALEEVRAHPHCQHLTRTAAEDEEGDDDDEDAIVCVEENVEVLDDEAAERAMERLRASLTPPISGVVLVDGIDRDGTVHYGERVVFTVARPRLSRAFRAIHTARHVREEEANGASSAATDDIHTDDIHTDDIHTDDIHTDDTPSWLHSPRVDDASTTTTRLLLPDGTVMHEIEGVLPPGLLRAIAPSRPHLPCIDGTQVPLFHVGGKMHIGRRTIDLDSWNGSAYACNDGDDRPVLAPLRAPGRVAEIHRRKKTMVDRR